MIRCAMFWVVLSAMAIRAAELPLFRMPLAARVTACSTDGKGWREQGVLNVTFVQAVGQFKSALAQSGWLYLHAVPINGVNARTLYTWKRGARTVTVMLWRIDIARTGFSWGVSQNGT